MKVQFHPARSGDSDHLAEALVIFEEAGLWGLALGGIGLWKSDHAPQGISVSLPGRTYAGSAGDERRYGFLRGDKRVVQMFQDTIRREFLRQNHSRAAGGPAARAAEGIDG